MTDTLTDAPDTSKNVEPSFTGSQEFADHLQAVLTDLIELHLQGKQAHWNVVGKNFRDLHLQLDEVVEAARGFSDEIAERMRALFITPDGRSSSVSKQTSLPPYPEGEVDTSETIDLITQRIYAACKTMRDVHDQVDDEDPTSADLLHGVLTRLEQLAWMVSAENRIANRTKPKPVHE